MSTNVNWSVCRIVCWGLALIGGLAMMIGVSGTVGVFFGLIFGIATLAIIGFLFTQLVCIAEPADSASMVEMGRGAIEKAKAASGVVARTDAATVKEKAGEVSSAAGEKVAAAAVTAQEKVAETAVTAKETVSEAAASAKVAVSDAAVTAGQKISEAAGTADPAANGKSSPKPKKSAKAASAGLSQEDVIEGVDEGTKPQVLPAPQGNNPDDLKQIKGVGPKLEGVLNTVGFYHFKQIASWSSDEVAWVNANLKGFKGRVTRDGWVDQAKILASGGDTEFSKRVEDGNVY